MTPEDALFYRIMRKGGLSREVVDALMARFASGGSTAPEWVVVTGTLSDTATVAHQQIGTAVGDLSVYASEGSVITFEPGDESNPPQFVASEPGIYCVAPFVNPTLTPDPTFPDAQRAAWCYGSHSPIDPAGVGWDITLPLGPVEETTSYQGVAGCDPMFVTEPGVITSVPGMRTLGLVGTDSVVVFFNLRVYRIATLA